MSMSVNRRQEMINADSDNRKVRVLIAGEFQQGKSTLLNCLLKKEVAIAGSGDPTTWMPVTYSFGHEEKVVIRSNGTKLCEMKLEDYLKDERKTVDARKHNNQEITADVILTEETLRYVSIIDSPGRNSPFEEDGFTNELIDGGKIDYVVYVVDDRNTMCGGDKDVKFLRNVQRKEIPVALVMNCFGGRHVENTAKGNERILADIGVVMYNSIFITNLLKYWENCKTNPSILNYSDKTDGVDALRDFLLPSPWNFLSSIYSRAHLHRAVMEYRS
jgi:predicted GTPase